MENKDIEKELKDIELKNDNFFNEMKMQSENDEKIRTLKAELIQKKYGSTVNVDDFFKSYTNELSNFSKNIEFNNITNFCEEDCTIIKIEPTKVFEKTENELIKECEKSEPEIIYFGEDSEKVGYKSFQYYWGNLNLDNNKLILTDLNDEQITLTGQDISDEIKKIMEIL